MKAIFLIAAILFTVCVFETRARSIRKLDKEILKHEDTFNTYETDGESDEAKKNYASIQKFLDNKRQLGKH